MRSNSTPQYILSVALVLLTLAFFSPLRFEMSKGNRALEKNNYDKAINAYKRAKEHAPKRPEVDFNLGNAYYRKGAYDKAVESYTRAAHTKDSTLAAHAYANMGNAHYRANNLQKAIEAYTQSLRLNPTDDDVKRNLEIARKKLKEQTSKNSQNQQEQNASQKESQKNNQQDGEKGDKDASQSEGSKEGNENDTQDGKRRDNSTNQNGTNQNQAMTNAKEQQSRQAEPKTISEEEAQRILRALRAEQQAELEKAQREKQQYYGGGRGEEDW